MRRFLVVVALVLGGCTKPKHAVVEYVGDNGKVYATFLVPCESKGKKRILPAVSIPVPATEQLTAKVVSSECDVLPEMSASAIGVTTR